MYKGNDGPHTVELIHGLGAAKGVTKQECVDCSLLRVSAGLLNPEQQ